MSQLVYKVELLLQPSQDAFENGYWLDDGCHTGASGFGYVAIDWTEFKIEDNLHKPCYQQVSFDRRFVLIERKR